MTKEDFELTRELLRDRGFTVTGAAHDPAHFGSWWVSVARQPPLRIAWDGKGDWDRAHRSAQEQHDAAGAIVHAYLHRKEGDLTNARYWYAHANRVPSTDSLQAEWTALAGELLARE